MRRIWFAIGVAVILAVAWYVAFPTSVAPPASHGAASDRVATGPATSTIGRAASGPGTTAGGFEAPKPTPPIPPDQRAKPIYTPDPDDDRALVGLGLSGITDGERERLKVPDRFGRGVIITSIHPDAPAVEAGLAINDVIVRARRTAVNSLDDLSKTVGNRKHTVLTVSRDGKLFHVVLHKPYIPSPPAPAN